MKKKILGGILIISIFGFLLCTYMLFNQSKGYIDARRDYSSASEEFTSIEEVYTSEVEEIPSSFKINVDWEKIKKINPDVFGWIYQENTVINYPITVGVDNEYYLTHNFRGKKSISGGIFADIRNDRCEDSERIILYGHTMKDGSMFHSLRDYKSQKYYKKNPEFYIALDSGVEYQCKIFAAFVTTDSDEVVYDFVIDNSKFFEYAKENSLIESDVVYSGERIVTLSTCDGSNTINRMVVCAIANPLQ